ncbi:hypothetical protein B9Z55_003626 [Caenorhabditis nigoni]|uniref:Uncharacterized protein n=1 Tax=Caenorhabditis nigoni TaxID=1611254 RepID=A0A2G5VRZ6_9PELO|nr:hypothetical protein B9Z55_003626 [Caenorhabditis nigoni]
MISFWFFFSNFPIPKPRPFSPSHTPELLDLIGEKFDDFLFFSVSLRLSSLSLSGKIKVDRFVLKTKKCIRDNDLLLLGEDLNQKRKKKRKRFIFRRRCVILVFLSI